MPEKPFITITDVTLRDGSHAIRHQFTREQVRAVARALDGCRIPIIEVSHGDGLAGSSFQYGFSREEEEALIAAAAEEVRQGQLAVLLLPGIGTRQELRSARELGAQVARVATHVTEADIAEQHIGLAKEMGMTAVGFLMMAHMEGPGKIAEQGRLMESYGADCVYVVDSAGAMTTEMARARVAALREAVRCQVGFHAHNNLSLAVANTVAAIEDGATWVDASTCGFGAGSGNTATEVLVAVLDRLGYATGIDLYGIMDAAEEVVTPILPRPQIIDRDSLIMGYAGVYSSFLLHTKRAAARFGVDARDILVELGRRKVVGGQEDMIVDVALEIRERQPAARKQAETTAME